MSSALLRVLAILLVVVLAGLGATLLLDDGGSGGGRSRLVPGAGTASADAGGPFDPLAYAPGHDAELSAAAAAGNAHVVYAKSPDGVRVSAARTARYRPLIETAARAAKLDPDTLEAIVLLESAGRPDAAADPRFDGAVGLTQILAETGRDLLGMHVDPAGARRVTRAIAGSVRSGDRARVLRLLGRRRQIDQRFDPLASIQAAARYLRFARGKLGRDDLAVVSYHMGVGNLQQALTAYGEHDISYARLYFDSTPLHRSAAWAKLAALGDDSATYLWRVQAAREIMRLYRSDPAQLDRLAALQTAKNSAEEVLHPSDRTERFATAPDLRAAYADGRIRALPRALLARYGVRMDPGMGALAPRIGAAPRTYRGLRPEALALLVYLGAGVKAISGRQPLALTSTVRDERYQRQLIRGNLEATRNYSLHTSGYAFDILRSYATRAQGQAFQFMLGRLQSENLIAWVREPAAIHITVSSAAQRLTGLLGRRR